MPFPKRLNLRISLVALCEVAAFSLRADKIDFSAPAVSLSVPHTVQDDKELQQREITTQPIDDLLMNQDDSGGGQVLMLSRVKPQKSKTDLTEDYLHNRSFQNDYRSDDPDQSLDSYLGRQATNSFSVTRYIDLTSREYRENRLNERYSTDSQNWMGRTDKNSRRSTPFGNSFRNSDRDGEIDNSDDIRRNKSILAGLGEGQKNTYATESDPTLFIQQLRDGYYSSHLSEASQTSSAFSPGRPNADSFTTQREARAKASLESPSLTLKAMRPQETVPFVEQQDPFATAEPPTAPKGQVQSRPAYLPFPKKPGSLLQ